MHTHLDEFAIDAASANTNLTCGIPLAQVAKENLICWNCSPDVGSSYPAGVPTCGIPGIQRNPEEFLGMPGDALEFPRTKWNFLALRCRVWSMILIVSAVDSEGIRAPARRDQWISSPSP